MHHTGTEKAMHDLASADMKLHGGPVKGRHIGGGIHVVIPDNPPGPGWTTIRHSVRKHPDRKEWSYTVDDSLVAKLQDSGARKLCDAAELAELEAAIDGKKNLGEDWTPPDATPLEELVSP